MTQFPLPGNAISLLKTLRAAPEPESLLSPAIAAMLVGDGLATRLILPSPHEADRGQPISWLALTPKGRDFLENRA